MSIARPIRFIGVFIAILSVPASGPVQAQSPDDPARFIALIEGPQSPTQQGFDPLTLQQIMERFHVPGGAGGRPTCPDDPYDLRD